MTVKLQLQNKIINGAFDYWQRGTSFAAIPAGTYVADRWQYSKAGTFVNSVIQSVDVPANAFGKYSVLIGVSTALTTLISTNFLEFRQIIEGNVLRTFKNKKMVLRFSVKSNKPGIYCIALKNGDGTRSFIHEYTIHTADTWEEKTVRFQHDPTGSWDYGSGTGLRVIWCLGAGTNYVGTNALWQDGNLICTTNQVNFSDSVSNTFRLADVILVEDNEGQTRQPDFMYAGRDYFEELQLCQRYYLVARMSGYHHYTGGTIYNTVNFPVQMRATPSLNETILSSDRYTKTGDVIYDYQWSINVAGTSGNYTRYQLLGELDAEL